MRFRDLPTLARSHIGAVIAAGALLGVWSAFHGPFNLPVRFVALLAAAIIFNTIKIELTAVKSTDGRSDEDLLAVPTRASTAARPNGRAPQTPEVPVDHLS